MRSDWADYEPGLFKNVNAEGSVRQSRKASSKHLLNTILRGVNEHHSDKYSSDNLQVDRIGRLS
jgi:hypothetical protein